MTILWEKQKLCREKKIQWKWNKLEENDNTSNAGATTWVKEDKTPNLGPFTGNPGVQQILCDPTKVWWITTFFEDNFFEMLCKETNLYYFQNQGKYCSSSKVLKWLDVNVVRATHKKKEWNQVHLQVLRSTTPQRGMFRDISQPQALLWALVFPKNFSS
jgi:hypothetical protein